MARNSHRGDHCKCLTAENRLRSNGYVEKVLRKSSYSGNDLPNMVRDLSKR